MKLLAQRLPPNTAIGLIDEPTFVGKSQIVHNYLRSLSSTPPTTPPKLSFIIGTDTLTRFFDPRYYTSTPGGMSAALARFFDEEGSRLISARRGGEAERKIEEAVLQRDEVRAWYEKGQVALIGSGSEDWVDISSTRVREAVGQGDWEALSTLVPAEIAEYIKEHQLYQQ